jgi:hypothetical protein
VELRALPRRIGGRLLREAFPHLERAGLHVLPKSYFSQVPDFAWLHANEALWRRPAVIQGVDWKLDDQVRWLEEVCAPYASEVRDPWYETQAPRHLGVGFGALDAMILHCFIRHARPKKIVEIGGGESTGIMAAAARLNERDGSVTTRITTIEPFASPLLAKLEGIELVQELAQAVPESIFQVLGDGDLLFIDSTHTVKTGSEVLRLFLEVIPALPAGVHIHVHDVVLPYLYRRNLGLDSVDPFDWQESSLLLALLVNNSKLRLRFCGSAIEQERTAELRDLFPSYRPRRVDRGLWDRDDTGGDWLLSAYLETQ